MRWLAIVVVSACASRGASEPVETTTPTAPEPDPNSKVKVITETKVEILDPIEFTPGTSTLERTSIPMLDAVARTLTGNPSIKRVAVQAFGADALASLQERLALSRAQLIVSELVARGVEPARLVPEVSARPPAGHPNAPIFLILERAP